MINVLKLLTVFSTIFLWDWRIFIVGFMFRRTNVCVAMQPFLEIFIQIFTENLQE